MSASYELTKVHKKRLDGIAEVVAAANATEVVAAANATEVDFQVSRYGYYSGQFQIDAVWGRGGERGSYGSRSRQTVLRAAGKTDGDIAGAAKAAIEAYWATIYTPEVVARVKAAQEEERAVRQAKTIEARGVRRSAVRIALDHYLPHTAKGDLESIPDEAIDVLDRWFRDSPRRLALDAE